MLIRKNQPEKSGYLRCRVLCRSVISIAIASSISTIQAFNPSVRSNFAALSPMTTFCTSLRSRNAVAPLPLSRDLTRSKSRARHFNSLSQAVAILSMGGKGTDGNKGAHDGLDYVLRRADTSDSTITHFEFVAECELPTEKGFFRLRSYRVQGTKVVMRNGERVEEAIQEEPVVMYKGQLSGREGVLVRVHDQCFTSEVLGSQRCDCKEQLDLALDMIQEHGGAVLYLPQEGRGIGLANKIAAYQLQDTGFDTVDANRLLGFGDDERTYACVPHILADMGIRSIELLTNNPRKENLLTDCGVKILRRRACLVKPNKFNEPYLRAKAVRMAHKGLILDSGSSAALKGRIKRTGPRRGMIISIQVRKDDAGVNDDED